MEESGRIQEAHRGRMATLQVGERHPLGTKPDHHTGPDSRGMPQVHTEEPQRRQSGVICGGIKEECDCDAKKYEGNSL